MTRETIGERRARVHAWCADRVRVALFLRTAALACAILSVAVFGVLLGRLNATHGVRGFALGALVCALMGVSGWLASAAHRGVVTLSDPFFIHMVVYHPTAKATPRSIYERVLWARAIEELGLDTERPDRSDETR